MNIVQPYAKILAPISPLSYGEEGGAFRQDQGIDLLRRVEFCGRISHRSEDTQTPDSWRRFIQAVVIGHGDWSIVEHAAVTVDFLVDRGITHEIVRHRLFSFTQESTRFVNYEKKMPPSFIDPTATPGSLAGDMGEWQEAVSKTEEAYKQLIKLGWSPQMARSVFPNALASRLLMTGNLRSWRHFLIMRTTKEAHPQMRQVTIPLLAEFQAAIPLLFDDIQPNARQADNLKLPR